MGDVWAIVVAAGSGSRFGDGVPKQFSELGGLRLLDWALSAAGAACDGVVIVLPAAQLDATLPTGVVTVTGGPTPAESGRPGPAPLPGRARLRPRQHPAHP